MRPLIPTLLAGTVLLGLTAGPTPPPYAAVQIQTDSLRAETYRPQGTRRTVVRRMATRIDSIVAAWVPDTVQRWDTVVVSRTDTLLKTDTVRVPMTADSVRSALVRLLADSINRTATNAKVKAWAQRISTLEAPPVVTPPPPPPPPPDTTPPPPPPAPGVAELPRDTVPLPPMATWPCTQTVAAGGNLQAAITSAVAGDVLCLATGATFTGSFVLPNRSDGAGTWVVIRPAVHDSLYALPGERLRPSRALAARLPIILTVDRAFRAAPGAHGWRLIGLDIQSAETVPLRTFSLIELGENVLGAQPEHIALDRLWLHPTTPAGLIRRAVTYNGGWLSLEGSWCEDIHETGQDSQCVIGFNGTGPYRISNNYLSASSEIFMMGGGDPADANRVAADVTIRRNHFYRPPAWKGSAAHRPIKSTIETKSVMRVLIEGNVVEGGWKDGHEGEAIQLKSADQGGRCHLCRTSDVTIRRNYITHHGTGLYLVGRDNTGNPAARTDSVLRRIVVEENWFDSTNVAPYVGRAMQAMFIAGVEDVAVSRNVWAAGANMNSYLSFTKDGTFGLVSVARLTWRDNIVQPGQYGVVGCPSAPAWTNCASNVTFGATGLIGSLANVTLVPGAVGYPSVTAALAAGLGVPWSTIQAAIAGVVVPRGS